MDLSIVIVNLNTRLLLADAIAALPDACHGLTYETLVVDNGSTDGSPAFVRDRFPSARLLVNERNVGFAVANNQALRLAQGDFVLLLNSDTRAEPGSIEALVRFMQRLPRAGIAGPRLLNADGSFQGSAADFPTVARESLLLLGGIARWLLGPTFPYHPLPADPSPREVDWVSGACLLTRREVIDQIGDLDAGYFMYTEETDWCYRVKRAGWSVWWNPEPVVFHLSGATAQQTFTLKRRQLYASKARFFRKHQGRAAAWMFAAGVWITSLIKTAYWGAAWVMGAQARRGIAKRNAQSYLQVIAPDKSRSGA